jgi:hypothetical protein
VHRWWLRATWEVVRDVLVTGTGLVIIWRQVLYASLHPSGILLGTGLALTVPSVAAHLRALLPAAGGESESSPPSPPASAPRSSSPPAGT